VAFHGGRRRTRSLTWRTPSTAGGRFLNRQLHHTMPGLLERVVQPAEPQDLGAQGGAAEGGFGQKRDVWHRPLDSTLWPLLAGHVRGQLRDGGHVRGKQWAVGPFSLAMYEANYVMEDTSEVSNGVVMGRRERAELLLRCLGSAAGCLRRACWAVGSCVGRWRGRPAACT